MVEDFTKNITIVEIRIKLLRDMKGLSQKELANALNISRSMVNNWENGYINISLRQLVKLAHFYQTPIDYILGLTTWYDKNIYEFINQLDLKYLGEHIRKIRKAENLTQVEFAKQIKRANDIISNYERGKKMISTADLKDICNSFGYSADWCLGNTKTCIRRDKKITIKENEIRIFIES